MATMGAARTSCAARAGLAGLSASGGESAPGSPVRLCLSLILLPILLRVLQRAHWQSTPKAPIGFPNNVFRRPSQNRFDTVVRDLPGAPLCFLSSHSAWPPFPEPPRLLQARRFCGRRTRFAPKSESVEWAFLTTRHISRWRDNRSGIGRSYSASTAHCPDSRTD